LIDNDSNVDMGWFVSVAELVRLRAEGFLRDKTGRLSSVVVCFNENNSSSKYRYS
jgi:predicted GNAT superfamily acetyltransferase